MTNIIGTVAPGWEPVREAFAANLANTEELGAGVSAYHRGVQVVDLWGGWFDTERTVPYAEHSLQLVFSTTKGITAIAIAICVDRGLLSYDAPVSQYWPEFAAHGKGHATVAQLLSHQVGLYTVDGPITIDEALDWNTITARLADTAPRWPIGAAHGYHALTYGWLAGELVRRVDPTHRSLGTFVQEEITQRLGIDLWVGLPAEFVKRVSPILASQPNLDPAVAAMMAQFMGPGTPGGDALSLNGAFNAESAAGGLGTSVFNTSRVLAAEIPAANGVSNAPSLAKVYAATMAPIDGVQLISDAVRNVARVTVTPENEPDNCLIMPTTFGMGFMTSGPFSLFAGPGSYGHPGAGGSVAFAQPERQFSFAYVMNQMANNLAADMRAQALVDACTSVIDSL
jgi:CubicO group peptidase (beta-lactamase class C family)